MWRGEMNIGNMIKQERERQGLSMNKLAKIANIGQSTLSYIEAGYRQPTFDVLERIITALGFSLSDFFAYEQKTIDPELTKLLQATKKLNSEQRKLLCRFVNSL